MSSGLHEFDTVLAQEPYVLCPASFLVKSRLHNATALYLSLLAVHSTVDRLTSVNIRRVLSHTLPATAWIVTSHQTRPLPSHTFQFTGLSIQAQRTLRLIKCRLLQAVIVTPCQLQTEKTPFKGSPERGNGRSRWQRGLMRGYAIARLLILGVRNLTRARFVCCQVEVSATGPALAQRSPTVRECHYFYQSLLLLLLLFEFEWIQNGWKTFWIQNKYKGINVHKNNYKEGLQ